MQSASSSLWGSRLATLLLWALATGSMTYWVLKWPAAGQGMVNAPLPQVDVALPTVQAVATALGGGQATVAAPGGPVTAQGVQASSRMALVGVVATQGNRGTALIAIDGKPARPFRVGAKVDGDLVLQSVAARQAKLGPGPDAATTVTLEIPVRK